MSRGRPIAVLRDELATHPAARAWQTVTPGAAIPDLIEVLREHPSAAVYRLVGAGPRGAAIIAKRTSPTATAIESAVYLELLPRLPLTAARCYGTCAGDGPFGWLLLEDVGEQRFAETDRDDLALVARWVAVLHTRGAALPAPAAGPLPDAGPERYLAHLRAGRERIQRRLARPALEERDVVLLESIRSAQDDLESHWDWIEEACAGLPATLVHGDFRPRNVFVRREASGPACYPVDWETAGWGVPAADLAFMDPTAYWTVARSQGEDVTLETVQRLRAVGRVFRGLASIDWESVSLEFDSSEVLSKVMASLAVLAPRLTSAVDSAGVMHS
jgi:phosphotransferase family enzyme